LDLEGGKAMSETKFTKGPWEISDIAETHVHQKATGRGVASAGGYQKNVDWESVWKENLANAHLITAAPEMYEALEVLSLSADCLQCKHDQEDPDVIAVRIDMDDAEIALAKARGEEVT